jgi:hypothetical protein
MNISLNLPEGECLSQYAIHCTAPQDAMPTATALPTTTKALSGPPAAQAAMAPIGLRQDASGQQGTVSTVVMPSGASVSAVAPTGEGTALYSIPCIRHCTALYYTVHCPAVVPAGAGAAFPRPHPGDGSMDFTKTEMVTLAFFLIILGVYPHNHSCGCPQCMSGVLEIITRVFSPY